MPSTASETFYDLAIRALEEQEREVIGLRTRTGTLAAAAAIAGTVLAREVFAGDHPNGAVAWTATVGGVVGLALVLAASVFLLRSHRLSFGIDAAAALDVATDFGAIEAGEHVSVHLFLAQVLSERQARNGRKVRQLRNALAIALVGLAAEIVGLGLSIAIP